MKVIANRQLIGEYGTIPADQEFECPDEIVKALSEKGMVRSVPRIEYQTKIITPEAPEVSPREPFRDGDLPHEEPAQLAPESNRILSQSDIPERTDVGGSRRRRRPRSGS